MYDILLNEEQLKENYLGQQKSISSISLEFGKSYSTIRRALIRFNIPIRSSIEGRAVGIPTANQELQDKERFIELYVNNNKSLKEMAEIYDCSEWTICKYIGIYNVGKRDSNAEPKTKERIYTETNIDPSKQKFPELHDKEFLELEYLKKKKPMAEIAEIIGCSDAAVSTAIRRMGIPKRAKNNRHPMLKRSPKIQDKEWMYEQYVILERSKEDIADELEIKSSTVQRQLTRLGISRRKMKKKENWHSNALGPGRKYNDEWYIKVYMPEHSNSARDGWILEHRLVASQALGRPLTEKEEVHHVNHKKDDNRIENLMVFPTKHDHLKFHHNPPSWIITCPHCNKVSPEELSGRPEGVPLLWEP